MTESLQERVGLLAKIQRWQMTVLDWYEKDPEHLAELARDSHWFGRVEQPDQVLLIAVSVEHAQALFRQLLESMPEAARLPVMQAFTAWAAKLTAQQMEGLTPEQIAERHAKAMEETLAMVQGLRSPRQ